MKSLLLAFTTATLAAQTIEIKSLYEPAVLAGTWKQQTGMVGLRWSLTRDGQQTWHNDGTMDWLWPAAEKTGTPIATMAWHFLPLFGKIAERHPDLKLIVDHMGVPRATRGAEAAYRNLPQLLALARHPNVAVKATGQAG